MVIAINAITLHQSQLEFYTYLKKVFEQIAEENNNHQFIFINDKNADRDLKINANCSTIKINTASKKGLQLLYLLNIKMPQILKKNKVDIVININDVFVSSDTPQIQIVESLNSKDKKNNFNKVKYIICFSDYIKTNIIEQYKIDTSKIDKLNIVTAYEKHELTFEKAMQVKDGYADGREYFLFNANGLLVNEIIDFLKSFSIFKKWQNSNMKLLLLNNTNVNENILESKLETYKYKDDVILLNNINESAMLDIIAACYCFIDIKSHQHLPIFLLQAINSKVSVICANNNFIKEIVGDSVLYVDSSDTNEIADKMKLIYRDENLRSNLISAASNKIEPLKLQDTAQQLWNIIST